MFNEFINIILKSIKLDKSLYSDNKNFGEASIYFAIAIILLTSLISIIPGSTLFQHMSSVYGITDTKGPPVRSIIIMSFIVWIVKTTYLYFFGVVIFSNDSTKCSFKKLLTLVAYANAPFIFYIFIFDISLSWEAANPTNKDELSGASLMVSFGTLLSLFVFALAWFWEIFPRARLILIGVQLGIYLSFLALASLTNGVPYLGSVFVILLFGFCATDMARAGRRGAAQFLLVLIGIRMLTFYIDAFGGLAITAVGLICVGVLILLTTLVWYRKRHNVMSWLEGVPK